MTVIVIALLAAAAGLVVLAAFAWRWAAARRQDLLAASGRVADRPHMQWLPGTCQTPIARVRYVLRPGWLFGTSVLLGLLVIASAAAGAGILVEDVTAVMAWWYWTTRWPASSRRITADHSLR